MNIKYLILITKFGTIKALKLNFFIIVSNGNVWPSLASSYGYAYSTQAYAPNGAPLGHYPSAAAPAQYYVMPPPPVNNMNSFYYY